MSEKEQPKDNDSLDDFELKDTMAERFSYENMMRQFLYQYCPDLDGEEFDDAMEELEALGRIAVREAEKE